MITDSGVKTNFSDRFEVLRISVVQRPSLSFTNAESITIHWLFFRPLAELNRSFLTQIVSTVRRNRRLSTKPVAGIAMPSMLLHTKCQVEYTMRNLFVMFVAAVCFLFLLKLKWPENKNNSMQRYIYVPLYGIIRSATMPSTSTLLRQLILRPIQQSLPTSTKYEFRRYRFLTAD